MLTAAEFKSLREHLGIPGEWIARRFGVSDRSVRHWDSGKYPVPERISRWLRWLAEDTEATVAWIAERLETSPESERLLVTYRNDEELDACAADDPHRGLYPDDDVPAAWHRRMAARVTERVPGLRLIYPGQTAADIPAAVTSLLDVTADCDDRADPEAWIEAWGSVAASHGFETERAGEEAYNGAPILEDAEGELYVLSWWEGRVYASRITTWVREAEEEGLEAVELRDNGREVWAYSYASNSAGAMSLVDARVVVGSEATPGEREDRVRNYVLYLETSGYERG